ncbi:U6 snRNA-associated Sm-like protein LSm2 [Chionoecetes opilio]|uniref:U6 snRNA-associated Sm-like protein LSm2 n=1 Tax=Chionoecetes opilio TaxID=41210 RepID=A0A8J5CNW7_CHIOP|nr:U6 snRNA-associated Sm-like protein LSm2 [Chionoecetes opilio]
MDGYGTVCELPLWADLRPVLLTTGQPVPITVWWPGRTCTCRSVGSSGSKAEQAVRSDQSSFVCPILSVKNCFIRGSVVRYVQLPVDEVDTQLLQDAARREAQQQHRVHLAGLRCGHHPAPLSYQKRLDGSLVDACL